MKPRYFIASIATALVVAYVLSVGPVVMLNHRRPPESPPPWGMEVYAPLFWIYQYSKDVRKFFDWYEGLWIPIGFE
jgi:hypothetical protein